MAATTALLRSSAGRALCSASAIVCKQATWTHVLRFDGYSQLSEAIGTGHHVLSSVFHIGSHSWSLRLYPNGESFVTEGNIGVFMCIESDAANEPVSARIKFSFLDRLGNPGFVRDTASRCFRKAGTSWGFHDLITKNDLEKSEYLNNDSFAIRCDMTVTTLSERPDHIVFIAGNTEPDATASGNTEPDATA
ncbi:hypothetical protein EJB05_13829, partial [Eragrostis curvula]